MDADVGRLVNVLANAIDAVYESVQELAGVLSSTDIGCENSLEIQLHRMRMSLNTLEALNSRRTKQASSEKFDPVLNTLKFLLVGHYLNQPGYKEALITQTSNSKGCGEFLTVFQDFCYKENEKFAHTILKQSKILEDCLHSASTTIKFCDEAVDFFQSYEETEALFQSQDFELSFLSKSTSIDESILKSDFSSKPPTKTRKIPRAPVSGSFCKIYSSPDEAVSDISSGDSLIIGGFGLVGTPEDLLWSIHRKDLRDLRIFTCLAGTNQSAIGSLIKDKMVSYAHISHIGSNTEVERQYLNGELEVEFTTQGSLVEKFRAAAYGIHSFYTPSGIGTFVEQGQIPTKFSLGGKSVEKYSLPKQAFEEKERKFFLEKAISGDYALIHAWKADTLGNLIYHSTAKNSNPDIAGSCRVTIAEVEEIVPVGALDPDLIQTPGIFVQRLVLAVAKEKPIERLTLLKPGGIQIPGNDEVVRKRTRIARRAAKEINDETYVNLGLGMPTLIPNYIEKGVKIVLHGENGVLGMGPYPQEGMQDPDTINASRETITLIPGSSTFSSSMSFGIIRGNHLDLTILGGMQVSENADLANWLVPGCKVKGMGGAIDLVSSQTRCIVCMDHLAHGTAKILEDCKLPLTGRSVVDMIITNFGVFEFRSDTGLTLIEIAEDASVEMIRELTPANFHVAENLRTMQ